MKIRLIVMVLFLVVLAAIENHFVSRAEMRSADPPSQPPELILQTGHSKVVEAVVFSPDNRWVASGSFDNTIKIWELESGRELRSLTGHSGAIKALTCSSDGKWLASGGNDNTLRIWDVESGKEIKNFSGQEGDIEAVAFSADGKKLASGGSANTVIIRDVETGNELAKFAGHTGPISSLAFSPDGGSLASGSTDQTIRIWDVAKGKLARTIKGHTDKIGILRFDGTGEVLASGSLDKTVRLWKTSSGKQLAVFSGHTGSIIALTFVPGDKLMSADSDRSVKVWDATGKGGLISTVRSTVSASAGEAECAAIASDGASFAIGNGDGTITLSNGKDGGTLTTLENHTVGHYGVTFSPDRHWLASASFDNTVKLWDLQTGRSLLPFTGHTGRVTAIVFHPDNKRIFSGSLDHTIRVWNTLSTKSVETLTGHTNSISSLAISTKGKLLVSGSADQTIGLWDLETKGAPRFLKGHSGEVVSVAISSDERFIASASIDATIKIWDVRSGLTVRTIEPQVGELDAVAFSPDGKLIVSGGIDKLVRIWETETGRLIQTLAGHTGKINAVSFSPDGKEIVSSSQDKTIRTWTVSGAKEDRVMSGHSGPVFSATYSNDGRFIASASDDGSIIIWKPENGNRMATLISLKNTDDWLVVTPEGFFDGSQASWEQLSWRFEKSTFNVKPVEVFFSEFYSPGLLADLLSNGKLPSNSNISNKDRRQPELKLQLADAGPGTDEKTRDVKIKIDVFRAPAGAKDVRLFRNGSLVKVWRGDVLKGQSNVVLDATIPIIAGENRLTAYAFNADDVKSRNATLNIDGAGSLMRKGVSYILSIGVNEYANGEYNLSQAVADAQDFAAELKRQQVKLGSFERVDVIALNDDNATKANILRSLSDLSAKIQPEDTLTIYFAGHGTAQKNRFYLIPHDLGYNGSRTQLDAAGLQTILSHSISDEELESVVEDFDVGQILLVIDACNSGQALEAEEKRRGPMNSKGLAQLAFEKGMYILTAAESRQAAIEDVRLGHGYLTYALIEEGLKTNLADRDPKDGQVLMREWLDYAAERVPQIDQEEITKGQTEGRELEREKTTAANAGVPRSPQRPRVFYRRDMETHPLVVARP